MSADVALGSDPVVKSSGTLGDQYREALRRSEQQFSVHVWVLDTCD
jgi:hypothetical protein